MADHQEGEDQFQADLAKALALSLESHAMENSKREDYSRVFVNVPQGRNERSSSISEDVVTTQVCPRSRPEGRKIDTPSSLPPPPPPEKRRGQSLDNTNGLRMSNQDLISFVSPNPGQKKESQARADLESINFDNNNGQTNQKFKAVQNLFSPTSEMPPPQPLPRTILPVLNQNGVLSYPNSTVPNGNHYNIFPGQPYQQNQTRMPYNFNLPTQRFVAGQSMFNQTVTRPVQPTTNRSSLQSFQNYPRQIYNVQPSMQRCNTSVGFSSSSGSMVKSSSWNDEMHTSTPKQKTSLPVQHTSPPPSITSDFKSSSSTISLESKSKHKTKKYTAKAATDSLIDLNLTEKEDGNTTTVSILQDFDPLNESDNEEEEIYWSSQKSNFSESFYDTHDPFSYMEQQAELSERIAEVEEDVKDSSEPPPAIPRRLVGVVRPTSIASEDTILRRRNTARNYENVVKKDTKIFECIGVERKPAIAIDGDVLSFIDMVRGVRRNFKWSDCVTNPGIVSAVKLEATYPANTEVKLVIGHLGCVNSVQFTASIDMDLDAIVAKVLVETDKDIEKVREYWLKVQGQAEFMCGGLLSDYEYVHQCYKYDKDIHLTLAHKDLVVKTLARTESDDENDCEIGFNQISPLDSMKTLSYNDLQILLGILQREADRISSTAKTLASCSEKDVMPALRPKQMLQAVKAVSALLGGVETLDVREACEQLITTCLQFDAAKGNEDPAGKLRPEIVEEVGERYAMVTLNRISGANFEQYAQDIMGCLKNIKNKVEALIRTYARTFRVDFELENMSDLTPGEMRLTTAVNETLLVRICCVHRLDPNWTYNDYRIDLRVYHGTKLIAETLSTAHKLPKQDHQDLYKVVTVDHWLEVKTVQISQIPLEARIVVSLVGRERIVGDKGESDTYKFTELGWASTQMFSHDKGLAQGAFLLPVWPVEANPQIGPAPDPGSHPSGDKCPLVSIELPELGGPVQFPSEIQSLPGNNNISFDQLDRNTKQQLQDFCEQDILAFNTRPPLDKEILWEKRHYLGGVSGALPKVLLAARSWDPKSLPSLYGMIEAWPKPDTIDVLQLFLPIFPDSMVRATAVDWLSSLPSDELVDYLPQLVEAVKHETWSASALSKLLINRSLTSPRMAHSLYWLLTQALPGISPQNSLENDGPREGMSHVAVARYHRRLQLLLRAVFAVSGEAVRNRLLAQQVLMHNLNQAATQVQSSKDNAKPLVLARFMEQLHHQLHDTPTLVPLSASLIANGADVKSCSYFNSNTFPLKLVLNSDENDGGVIKAIYKVGDDLRQDMLTLQMIRVMDRLWLRAGLDLRMVSFKCVPTGWKTGIVEFVEDASTLREIQVAAHSVTGAFRPEILNDWLKKHNPSTLEFESAVNNFTRSCAGYSVVTYIMGIGDRHNDNIMVKKSGHLFHIDFGKFLGDAQKFGSIKRDRVPFVFTPDMVYVINGGDKMTRKFHTFVDLCCQAFNSLRQSGNLLLTLFALMASSGIPGVTKEAVSYVQERLFLDLSNAEAAARFSQLIQESMASVSTQLNFFVHNLAQLKFGSDHSGEDEMLTFIPKKYNMTGEGRIQAVEVHGIQKRYDQEKYYVFILKVSRTGQKDPTYIFRTYKEFHEFHSKLCTLYPLTKFHSIPKGLSIGRSEVREVAERRKNEIGAFLLGLFRLADEISHSDLVYTFFHPLHRDQKEANIHINKLKEPKAGHQRKPSAGRICGKVKLSVSYRQDTLLVMVHHIENLSFNDPSREEPNSYVKVYLHPDPTKQTKRKTKVVKKNCNPSFMEMLEYRIPLDVVKCRTLQATVWDSSQFQENMFLGSATIQLDKVDLIKGEENWYSLGQFYR
eukprot:GFUD01001721.1.p1 GENE.GFUD01001721.1~~GFUD01001721.1.p1  ORF type:complete len:1837 (+),score=416.06 GFUD01001721.1:479-5989(+)